MAAPEGYKTLGKIGISYKGDYNINTAYERLDAVLHNGSTYLALVDAPDGAPRDDKINWIYLAKGFSSDIGDSEITFTEAEARENIDTGESVKTVFGKIKKFFTDLTAPAFAQMITSKDDLLATKATGYVPDAKAVADAVTDVTGKLDTATEAIVHDNITGIFTYTKIGHMCIGCGTLTTTNDIDAYSAIVSNLPQTYTGNPYPGAFVAEDNTYNDFYINGSAIVNRKPVSKGHTLRLSCIYMCQ